MNLLPLITRELRTEKRSQRAHRMRFFTALAAGVVFATWLVIDWWKGGLNFTRLAMPIPITGMGSFLLLIIGMTRAAQLLAIERQEGTLPLLLITRLSGYDIVISRMLIGMVVELSLFAVIAPFVVLPLAGFGLQWTELWMAALAWLNVLFFAMSCGIFGSVFGDGRVAASWMLIVLLPMFVDSSPFGAMLPNGAYREWLTMLHWVNPCNAVAHAPMASVGIRSQAYWLPLLGSHALAWGLLGSAGLLLPHVCRWQGGLNAGQRARKPWSRFSLHGSHRPLTWRKRLLNHNPFLWLSARDRWPTIQIWLWLVSSAAVWSWLAWAGRGIGLPIFFVIAMAVGCVWMIMLLTLIPAEACRRFIEDRRTGAFEIIFSTPLSVNEILQGHWLSLHRRYFPAVITVILLCFALMTVGYVTFGFGGMLDPDDRGAWLFSWIANILLLPLCLTTLIWVSLRRALSARNIGEASGVAILYVLILPGCAIWATYALARWLGWNPVWWETGIFFSVMFATILSAFAQRARRSVLINLREAATTRFCPPSTTRART